MQAIKYAAMVSRFTLSSLAEQETRFGVHYDGRGATTSSLVMRLESGTVRRITARHRLRKLKEYSSIEFG